MSMEQSRRRIDRITEESFLEGMAQWSLDEFRGLRAEVIEEESLLSYERRLIHGRMAILQGELDRRQGKETGSLVDRLRDILSDGTMGGNRGGSNLTDPKILFDRPSRPTTKLAMDDTLTRLDSLSDEEVQAKIDALRDAEEEVSGMRSKVLKVLDALNEELGRRYATGEANPADMLRG